MEEIVWVVVGVILVLLAFGSMTQIVMNKQGEGNLQRLEQDMQKLKLKCNFVCSSSHGTYLSEKITLPKESVLYSKTNKICTEINDDLFCEICDCSLGEYEMGVNLTGASFKEHTYSCFFERLGGENLSMECKG